MTPFALQLIQGTKLSDIEEENQEAFKEIQRLSILEEENNLYKLKSTYRVGELYIAKDGKGYIEATIKEQKDLLIEPQDLNKAKDGDIVIAKRIIAKRGRASGKVVFTLEKSNLFAIAYTVLNEGNFELREIKKSLPIYASFKGFDLSLLKEETVVLVDLEKDEVVEILGNFQDPKIDEKISLMLYGRKNEFPQDAINQALKVPQEVNIKNYQDRVDLRDLNFCTIDPVSAKDFDDAIYFDLENYTLYVAIADVSHYVEFFSPIDKEAKKRGFTTYFPHKSFPMLPRELSENICSLKPKVNRLAFISKIKLDKSTLEPLKEEFFEGVIHSKHRFNYEQVDKILETNIYEEELEPIISYLLPFYEITQKLRNRRLKEGFDFKNEEIKIAIDKSHLLKETIVETGTPSHSLVEEAMLLANRASAKRFVDKKAIFRTHQAPEIEKLEELLSELAQIGLFVESYKDAPSLIREIQKEAKKLNISSQVDKLLIKSLKQASYTPENIGHFGLGFNFYSHFTSPIRRYSDLILHRLIKTQLNKETKEKEYLLRNIDPLTLRVSMLEREATKSEWDFRDRKFARWAKENINKEFKAQIFEIGESSKALILGDIKGVVVNLKGDNLELFEEINIKITQVSIPQATIIGTKI